MKKRFFALLLTILSLCVTALPVAAIDDPEPEPYYTGVASATINMTISTTGRTTSTVRVRILPGYTADVYLDLQQRDGPWTDIMSWDDSGSGNIYLDGDYYVESGYYYRAKVTIDVYDSDGSYVETVTAYSSSQRY